MIIIYRILAISSMILLVSSCKTSGPALDKTNASSIEKAVTSHTANQAYGVTSNAVVRSNATTEGAKSLRP